MLPQPTKRYRAGTRGNLRIRLLVALLVTPFGMPDLAQAMDVFIACPGETITTDTVTPLAEPWRSEPQLATLRQLETREISGTRMLLCAYRGNGSTTAILREYPPDVSTCTAVPNRSGFVCTAIDAAAEAENAGRCMEAVQDRIAWDYNGNRRWQASNLERLCGNVEHTEPATCFDTVMHGGVNHGEGTQWDWRNALRLCASSGNAKITIGCFEVAIRVGTAWREAIRQCRGE